MNIPTSKNPSVTKRQVGLFVAALLVGAATVYAVGRMRSSEPHTPLKSGTYVTAVFIGTETCRACRSDSVKAAVRKALDAVRTQVKAAGMHYSTLGVAADWSPQIGAQFLRDYFEFDEIAAGRNWLNTTLAPYVWGDPRGEPAVPQIIVTSQDIVISPQGIVIGQRRVLERIVGARELVPWASTGAALHLSGVASAKVNP